MIKFVILLLGIAGLTMASNEHNFAKLVKNLEKLGPENLRAIENYHKNGYYTFEDLAGIATLTAEQKELMKTTPKNQSVQSNLQVKKAYDELKYSEFTIPQVSRPARLADGFKAALLQRVVLGKAGNLEAVNQLKKDVMKIVAEENKIDRKFDHPSKSLETLYAAMKEKHYIDMMFTSEAYTFLGQNIQDYCDKKAGNCDAEFTRELARYFAIDKEIRDAVPVDRAEKVDKLLKDMKEFHEIIDILEKSMDNLYCHPSGCEKAH